MINKFNRYLVLAIFVLTTQYLFGHCWAQDILIPRPTTQRDQFGTTTFQRVISIEQESLRPQALAFADAIKQLEGGTPIVTTRPAEKGELSLSIEAGTESYRLEVAKDQPIRITASTNEGIAQGLSSLLQLARISDEIVTFPNTSIEDKAHFEFRCVMIDLGRNPHEPDFLKKIVDVCWFFKINHIMLHLSDDQICSWPSKAFPKILSKNAGWTWDDFVELESYAIARGISVIPSIDIPAHTGTIRRAYPETFGASPNELASSDTAREAYVELLGELAEVFPSTPYIHVGADEAAGVPQHVQRDLLNYMNQAIKKLGKKTIAWEGPQIGQEKDKIDADIILMPWQAHTRAGEKFVNAGYQVVNATWIPMYVVDHYPKTKFTAYDLEMSYLRNPMKIGDAEPVESDNILGFNFCWWEGRQQYFMPLCLPRIAAVSCRGWNLAAENDFPSFQRRCDALLPKIKKMAGITYRKEIGEQNPLATKGNLALGCQVNVSRGSEQPYFSPDRLTNGFTEFPDHFMGYTSTDDPIEITVALAKPSRVSRIVVYERAYGKSWEDYSVEVSHNGEDFHEVGESVEGKRAEKNHITYTFDSEVISHIRITSRGYEAPRTFRKHTLLTEIAAFEN